MGASSTYQVSDAAVSNFAYREDSNVEAYIDAHGDYVFIYDKNDDSVFGSQCDDLIRVDPLPLQIQPDANWDDVQNQRRCDLIDKEIDGTITDSEQIELLSLHARLRQHLDKVAPVPLEGARKLHAQLLEKKRQREAQD
jgi:hypothetical protein